MPIESRVDIANVPGRGLQAQMAGQAVMAAFRPLVPLAPQMHRVQRTDIARESLDVVLSSSDLDDLGHTVHVTRRARRIAMFNFAGTIAVDLLGMVLAAFGVLSLIAAAFMHVGSETVHIFISAQLLPCQRGG